MRIASVLPGLSGAPQSVLLCGGVESAGGAGGQGALDRNAVEDFDGMASLSSLSGTSAASQLSATKACERRTQRIVRSPGLRAVCHGCAIWRT